ncbi:MAG TPA: hypothetical protein VEL11_15125 [Candidatus Bathyarchaeia archaeon]|nr:hypothetical protein [Candidatus Bathyarchaeia archaeon]
MAIVRDVAYTMNGVFRPISLNFENRVPSLITRICSYVATGASAFAPAASHLQLTINSQFAARLTITRHLNVLQ